MTKKELKITPSITVHKLLGEYPELEDKLIALAPPFQKLRNPALRRSVAKIATLKNIASVANIPLNELIDTINQEIGNSSSGEVYKDEVYFTPQPAWFSADKVTTSVVEGKDGDKDKMTVVTLLREAKKLKDGEILEFVTTFLPAPGIDSMKSKGYLVWVSKSDNNTIRSCFMKAG